MSDCYRVGELVFLRCRVLHDCRGPGRAPRGVGIDANGDPTDDVGPAPRTDEVLIESVSRGGKPDDALSVSLYAPSAHVVSADEVRRIVRGVR